MGLRLKEQFAVDKEKTFGRLRFAGLKSERKVQTLEGTLTDEVEKRRYSLKSDAQGTIVEVNIPGNVPLKEFERNAVVDIINPMVGTVSDGKYRAEADWYINADDLVLKNAVSNTPKPAPSGGQNEKKDNKPGNQN